MTSTMALPIARTSRRGWVTGLRFHEGEGCRRLAAVPQERQRALTLPRSSRKAAAMTSLVPRSALLAALLLAGCVSPTATQDAAPAPAAAAPRYSPLGLEGVIGRTARFLEAEFGRPDLDIREGTARKLQFASQVCVLDAYLYPPKAGGEPIVTYVDARTPDGRDIDRASCVAALTRRPQAR